MTTVLAKIAPAATDMIRNDHARVLTTFHRYKSDASVATKRSLVASLCLALGLVLSLTTVAHSQGRGAVEPPHPDNPQSLAHVAAAKKLAGSDPLLAGPLRKHRS